MRSRWTLLVMLASALVFLATLFLPWREAHVAGGGGSSFLFFSDGNPLDGWLGGVGDVAVLLAVALAFATGAALLRPHLAAKLPLGGLGVGLGYFTAAVAVQAHATSAAVFPASTGLQGQGWTGTSPASVHYHTTWAYGFYLGAAAGGAAVLCGLALRRRELLVRRSMVEVVSAQLGVALLVSFLLPWAWLPGPHRVGFPGMGSPAAAIAALGLVLGASRLLGSADEHRRLPFALATAILVGGAASSGPLLSSQAYGTWVGVGCAGALVLVEVVRARQWRLPTLPSGWAALRSAAAVLLLVALFLPWRELRAEPRFHGQGFDGWGAYGGAVAGCLALLLLAAPALRRLERYALEGVLAVAFLVSAQGGFFAEFGNSQIFRMGYGLYVGFAATALMLIATLVPFRPVRVDGRRVLVRALPLGLSVAGVAAVVVPWWFVVPRDWTVRATAVRDWLSVPALFLALFLVRSWVLATRKDRESGHALTLAPLGLLVLPALELIRLRAAGVIWAGVILIGLCLLLAGLGWIEESGGGLESFRVPEEIWRVDRLPEIES